MRIRIDILGYTLLCTALLGCSRFDRMMSENTSGAKGSVEIVQPTVTQNSSEGTIRIKMVSLLNSDRILETVAPYKAGEHLKLDSLAPGPYAMTVSLYRGSQQTHSGHNPNVQVEPGKLNGASVKLYATGKDPGSLALQIQVGEQPKRQPAAVVVEKKPKAKAQAPAPARPMAQVAPVAAPQPVESRPMDAPREISVSATDTVPCAPVKHFHYNLPLGTFRTLSCNQSTDLFNVKIPAKGFALARASLALGNSANVPYQWTSQVNVGRSVLSQNAGDGLCPGTTGSNKQVMGYGELRDNQNGIQVSFQQAAPNCTDGKVVVLAGASLDVWVEAPECPKRDILIGQHTQAPTNLEACLWQEGLRPAVSVNLSTSPDRSNLIILGHAEANFEPNVAHSCGQETAALVTSATLDGAMLGTSTDLLPGHSGPGRLSLSAEHEVTPAPGRHSIGLKVGGNFPPDSRQPASCGGSVWLGVVRTQ